MASPGGIFLCFLIVILDIVAGILGIEAEIAQNKVMLMCGNIHVCEAKVFCCIGSVRLS